MRRGYEAQVLLDDKGEIFAISTGSDACTEHECGSKPLMAALCEGVKLFSRHDSYEDPREAAILKALRAGEPAHYPKLIERKRIQACLTELVVKSGADTTGTPCAVLGFSVHGPRAVNLDDPELTPWKTDVSGAWDSEGFALRVCGEILSAKLQRFHAALMAKKGLFAGTFLPYGPTGRLSGVIIAREDALSPQHQAAIEAAQQAWEADLRLKARSQLDAYYARFRSARLGGDHAHIALPGHIWPVWRNNVVDGEVAYALNPGYGVKARYWGPYALEALERWTFAKEKFELIPLSK